VALRATCPLVRFQVLNAFLAFLVGPYREIHGEWPPFEELQVTHAWRTSDPLCILRYPQSADSAPI